MDNTNAYIRLIYLTITDTDGELHTRTWLSGNYPKNRTCEKIHHLSREIHE